MLREQFQSSVDAVSTVLQFLFQRFAHGVHSVFSFPNQSASSPSDGPSWPAPLREEARGEANGCQFQILQSLDSTADIQRGQTRGTGGYRRLFPERIGPTRKGVRI